MGGQEYDHCNYLYGLGYWATGVTTHANKIFLGYGIGELFLERLCWAFIFGWALIPVAIIKTIFFSR